MNSHSRLATVRAFTSGLLSGLICLCLLSGSAFALDDGPLPKFTFRKIALHPKDLAYAPNDDLIHPTIVSTAGRVANPLGRYYLYHAPHKHIATSMAYSDSIEGPWKEYQQNPVVEGPSAPDVRWIEEKQKFYLWGHKKNSQTELWTSDDGITFNHHSVSITAKNIGTRNATYSRTYEYPLKKYGSKYVMLYSGFLEDRGIRCVWLAHSSDAENWVQLKTPLVEPIEGEMSDCYGPSLLRWKDRNFVVYQDHTSWRGGNIKYVEVDQDLNPVGDGGKRFVLLDPPDEPPLNNRYRGAEFYFDNGRLYLYSSASRDPRLIVYATAEPDEPDNRGLKCSSEAAKPTPEKAKEERTIDAEQHAEKRPNILFLVSEDNSEHLGCYGEQRVHTPHLDALAAGGVRYTRAYVPYSVCSPSRAAFLTGLYTRQTGHIGLATHRFAMYRSFKTIPAYFRQAGYYTGFLGKTHINPEPLVEDFIDHRAIPNSNFSKTISIKAYAREAHNVMRQAARQKKPFLLIINYADAHRKFVGQSPDGFPTRLVADAVPPFPWIGSDTPHLRDEIRDYFNCINRLDEGIGMVLDRLKETENGSNTLVIYISDHGADFPRAKGSIYEHGTRIPMIVNYPQNFPQPKVEDELVSTIDILPTMLRAAGLPIPQELPGAALQDLDAGKSPPRKYIHTFTTGSSPNLLYVQFGIRDKRYKLVYNPDRALNRLAESRYRNSRLPDDQWVQSFLHPPEYELFDLQQDPYEWTNLADSERHRTVRDRLLRAMQHFQREINDPFASPQNTTDFIAEQKEYQQKPYRKSGFRWPHLDMFRKAQAPEQ